MFLMTEKPKRAGLNFNHYTTIDMKCTTVRLYNTYIVTAKGNQIELQTEGYRTNHAKNVMNDFLSPLGYKVYQKNGLWYVSTPNNEVLDFFDGMYLNV